MKVEGHLAVQYLNVTLFQKCEFNVCCGCRYVAKLNSCLLNPQSGYIKIDAYPLQILCHTTSDVKFSHYFLLMKVK